jgi:hypothetical protein
LTQREHSASSDATSFTFLISFSPTYRGERDLGSFLLGSSPAGGGQVSRAGVIAVGPTPHRVHDVVVLVADRQQVATRALLLTRES